MSVLNYRDYERSLENNQRTDMSYKESIKAFFSSDCLSPYKLYKTKKFLFFKRKVFLKNIPCGICYACLKNREKISLVGTSKPTLDITGCPNIFENYEFKLGDNNAK